MAVLAELPAIEPHGTQSPRFAPEGDEAMFGLRAVAMRSHRCRPGLTRITRLRNADAVRVGARSVALQPVHRETAAIEYLDRWEISPVHEKVPAGAYRCRL